MSGAKIRLSQKEIELVTNSDLILTKNAILEKTKQLLLDVQDKQLLLLQSTPAAFSRSLLKSTPKISKGENYKGLPYLVLDFPRLFEPTGIFAIRTLFWWGNFFSVTLHLSGHYKERFENQIMDAYHNLAKKGFYICVNSEQWEHHFEKDNFQPLSVMQKTEFEKIIKEKIFIKLSHKILPGQWNDAREHLVNYFKQIVETMSG